jgi:hypothetical protein
MRAGDGAIPGQACAAPKLRPSGGVRIRGSSRVRHPVRLRTLVRVTGRHLQRASALEVVRVRERRQKEEVSTQRTFGRGQRAVPLARLVLRRSATPDEQAADATSRPRSRLRSRTDTVRSMRSNLRHGCVAGAPLRGDDLETRSRARSFVGGPLDQVRQVPRAPAAHHVRPKDVPGNARLVE